jgi:hypothetical protein
MYSLRHTFASLGRTAGEAAFNVAAVMGHSRSHLVDQVYAHSLQSGMASVAARVTARALGEEPKVRVVPRENPPAVRQPLDVLPSEPVLPTQPVDLMAPPAGVEHPLLSGCFRNIFPPRSPWAYPPRYPSGLGT